MARGYTENMAHAGVEVRPSSQRSDENSEVDMVTLLTLDSDAEGVRPKLFLDYSDPKLKEETNSKAVVLGLCNLFGLVLLALSRVFCLKFDVRPGYLLNFSPK